MEKQEWKVGNVIILPLVELDAGAVIQSILPQATCEAIKNMPWLIPYYANDSGQIKAVVQSFLIKSKGKFILIDACNGNNKVRKDMPEWGGLNTDFLKKIERLGISRFDISIVACTHLHMDHIGWNTMLIDGKWVPTFPNAKYICSKGEFNYWKNFPVLELEDDKQSIRDSFLPVLEAGLVELVDDEYKIDGNISYLPTPGHTPHHNCIKISSEGETAILTGDLFHHPCQITHIDWMTEGEYSAENLINFRKKVLMEAIESRTLIIGSHFSCPAAGYIKKETQGFRFYGKKK